MRFSVWPDQRRPWDEIAAIADHAEGTGWDGLYVYDHFMPNTADTSRDDGDVLECWTTLTAVAARTTRLRLGTLVLGNLYRHPALVANMAASLDVVSGGRLLLGLGAGWQRNEHDAYGITLPPPGERIDQFEEAVDVVVALLREERANVQGRWYQVSDAPCRPRPVQDRLPILIGGSGERRTIPFAARVADEWNAWARPDLFAHKTAILDAACEAAGRDPAEVRRSTQALVTLVDPGRPTPEAHPQLLAGSVQEVVDLMAEYERAGLDEFILPDHAAMPLAERLETTERFLTEVAAGFR